jgi:hypothetical protein
MAFSKGDPRPQNAGRKKGQPNKMGLTIKAAIENAFQKVGGEDYLVMVAREDPRVFCALLAKILPNINANVDQNGNVTIGGAVVYLPSNGREQPMEQAKLIEQQAIVEDGE